MSRNGAAGSNARVLVTEGEHRGALAACRALSLAGYEVAAAAGRRPAAAQWSRACSSRLRIPDPGESSERFVAGLESLVRRGGFDVLLPGGERSLLPISEHRGLLGSHIALGLPAHDAVLRSLDKVALLDAAASAGLRSPVSRVCDSSGELRRAVHELGFPVLVKPRRSVIASNGSLRQQPVSLVTCRSELEAMLVGPSTPSLVQRYEENARRLSCGGVMTDDGLVGFVVAQFIRTWPPHAGAVCFGETVTAPARVHERAEQLLDILGWRGIFELELLDLGGGRHASIDLNPRVFGWLGLAVAAGADLPCIWLESLSGADPVRVEPRVGVRYRWEDADLAHFLWQLRRRRLGAAVHVVRPRRHVVHAHFRLADPAPLAARLVGLARRRQRVA